MAARKRSASLSSCKFGDRGVAVHLLNQFLRRFGYLAATGASMTPADAKSVPEEKFDSRTREAIRRYQKFLGLRVTGTLDAATQTMMKRPRCGNPDLDINFDLVDFAVLGNRWHQRTLTFRFGNLTANLPAQRIRDAIERAFAVWSAVTPLRFRNLTTDPEIVIEFAAGEHGDGFPFDGPAGALAHAFLPPPSAGAFAGDVHFDRDEGWADDQSPAGFDLETVAIHEIGHSLGLDHSTDFDSVMFPKYQGRNRVLGQSDIDNIRRLYTNRTWRTYSGNQQVTAMVAYNGGIITAFDNRAYFNPIGDNLGGGVDTTIVYPGPQRIVALAIFRTGILTAFSSGSIYFSPDGTNLGGGGRTKQVYGGPQVVRALVPFAGGVITVFSNGIYRSPDGDKLGGGGNTVLVYSGPQKVVAIAPYEVGVITAFDGLGVYLSPQGFDVGGGGTTVSVYGGPQKVVALTPFRQGMLTAFSGGAVYFSANGRDLGRGTVVYPGPQLVRHMIPFRSGVITSFQGGGIYRSPDGKNLGGGGSTMQVYDGKQPTMSILGYNNGVMTAFGGGGIYFSDNGDNLGSLPSA